MGDGYIADNFEGSLSYPDILGEFSVNVTCSARLNKRRHVKSIKRTLL
jgi:hypothetical protein